MRLALEQKFQFWEVPFKEPGKVSMLDARLRGHDEFYKVQIDLDQGTVQSGMIKKTVNHADMSIIPEISGGNRIMRTMRKIIEIDETLCNGCGNCVPACAEGAIEIVNGKARLVAEKYCDGLGACLGDCPTGALRVIEREAEDFDEAAAHAFVESKKRQKETLACGCPSTHVRTFLPSGTPAGASCAEANHPVFHGTGASALTHWPVQIRLVPPSAPFLKGARLLVAADCVPVAYPAFHRDLLDGKTVLVGCPKFDDAQDYMGRFAEIFRTAGIKEVTLAVMEVPCCSAMEVIVRRAMEASGKDIPINKVVVGVKGNILS